MAKTSGKLSLMDLCDPIGGLDSFHDMYSVDTASLRRRLMENFHPATHYATSITNGMMSGTVCDGDADCSDATGADPAPAAAADDDDDGGDGDGEPARPRPSHTHPQAIAPFPASAPERRTATATAGDPAHPRIDPESELWPLPVVLLHVPISRSGWFAGVKSGRYPKPVRLSQGRVAWRASDIRSFVAAL